jgi:hypothetical protein
MLVLKKANLTILAFKLVADADKTLEENTKGEEDFKQSLKALEDNAQAAGLTCHYSLLPAHDSLIAALMVSKEQLENLQDLTLAGELLKFRGSSGQTVVLFGQPEAVKDYKQLAKDCCTGLGLQDVYLREGELFNSPIFEYQSPREETGLSHLWIWFETNPSTKTEIQAKWHEIRKLLLYRSKINYAYGQAKYASQRADELHLELIELHKKVELAIEKNETQGNDLKQRENELENLKKQLKEISSIGFKLFDEIRFLKYSLNSISVNSHDYLSTFKEIAFPNYQSKDIPFLYEFYQQSQKQLLPQISSDLNYATPSYELARQLISTIRGYVEIEQARCEQEAQVLLEQRDREEALRDRQAQVLLEKRDREEALRDRRLQDTIEALGIALGAVAIIASFAGMLEKPLCIPLWEKCSPIPHPFVCWVLISLLLAWIFYQIILQLKHRLRG